MSNNISNQSSKATNGAKSNNNQRSRRRRKARPKKQPETVENHTFSSDDDDFDNEDVELCLICCERLVYVAIGPCNHAAICANCTIRQRVLYKNRTCSLCKANIDHYVVTSDVEKRTWESWSDNIFGESCGGRLIKQSTCPDAFFDKTDSEYMKSVALLVGFACGQCNHANSGSVEQLKTHLKKDHKTFLCNVCVSTGRRFVSELPRFNKSQLERHNIKGEPTEGLRGHPPCNFCRPKRFYDDESLYHHMIEKHYSCDVCKAMGNGNRFFRNYQMLETHFSDAHYACEQVECKLKRFVVFPNEIDLQGHMATNHPNIKFNRKISVNFTVGRGMERGNASSEVDDTMTFSDDFMRTYSSTNARRGVGRSSNGSAASVVVGGGAVRVENAFPSLQEQKREQDEQSARNSGGRGGGGGGNGGHAGSNARNWVGTGRGLATVLGTGRNIRNSRNFPGLSRPQLNSAQDFPGLPGGGGGGGGGGSNSKSRHPLTAARTAHFVPSQQQQQSSKVHGKIRKDEDPFEGMSKKKRNNKPPQTSTGGSGGIVWECGRCTLVNKSTNRCTACGAWAQHGRQVSVPTGPTSSSMSSSIPQGIARAASSSSTTTTTSSTTTATVAHRKKQAMEKQKMIAETIRSILKPDRFKMFQRLCGSYAKQNISAKEYFMSVQRLCSYIELNQFWKDLLEMLPNDAMRNPLKELYHEAVLIRQEKDRAASNWSTQGNANRKMGGGGSSSSSVGNGSGGIRNHKKKEKTKLKGTTDVPSSVEEWIQLNGGGGQKTTMAGAVPSAPSAPTTDYPSLPSSSRNTIKLHRASSKKKNNIVLANPITEVKDSKVHGKVNKDDDPFASAVAAKRKKKVATEQQQSLVASEDEDTVTNAIISSFSSSFASSSSEPFVKLHGLVVTKKLNGKVGRRGVYSPAKGRYLVHFDQNYPEPLWIKDANMTIIEMKAKYPDQQKNVGKKDEWDTASFQPGSGSSSCGVGGKGEKKKKKKKKKKKAGSQGTGGFSVSEKGARAKKN